MKNIIIAKIIEITKALKILQNISEINARTMKGT